MKKRTFGDVLAEIIDGEGGVFLHARNNLSFRKAEELAENLKEALAWIRDQQRREKEEKDEQGTPLLPL
jgi:hypothetical protein